MSNRRTIGKPAADATTDPITETPRTRKAGARSSPPDAAPPPKAGRSRNAAKAVKANAAVTAGDAAPAKASTKTATKTATKVSAKAAAKTSPKAATKTSTHRAIKSAAEPLTKPLAEPLTKPLAKPLPKSAATDSTSPPTTPRTKSGAAEQAGTVAAASVAAPPQVRRAQKPAADSPPRFAVRPSQRRAQQAAQAASATPSVSTPEPGPAARPGRGATATKSRVANPAPVTVGEASAPVAPPPTSPRVSAPLSAAPPSAPASASSRPSEEAPPPPGPIDLEAFAGNLARLVEEGGKAMAAYMRPREEGLIHDDVAEDIADVMKTIGNVAEYWLTDPKRTVEAQARLIGGYLELWSSTLKRLSGKETKPVAEPPPRDGRFIDPEWRTNPFFDALKQTYLLTANWAEDMVEEAEIDAHTKHKAEFYVRQIASAVSPSNFVLTNPELLRTTLASNGENLVRGMKMLAEDIEAGGGDLKIRQTDNSKFKVGENLACTPGKVIFQNELMQLIQYTPQTESVLAVPLVIIPPWINKFYVLDLTPEKSFIRWAVEQGLTVFVVSWVNPGPELAQKGFEDYMKDGVLTAFEVAKTASGTKQCHAVGYCVGGTMLAMTLAWLAASGRDVGLRSVTFLTTQVDFTYAGDLKVFIDEEQVAHLERKMLEAGVMEGRKMANAFNMLRANDLIWPYVVNNYLKGQAPFPFDILYWNADSTRLPAANHSFYLRNCYLDNRLSQGSLMLAGKQLDLRKIDLPMYSVATREDHIAPANSVFIGLQMFGNPGRFVLAGSGHIAGVVNPPARGKYQYWTGGPPTGALEDWIAGAQMHPGSWWPDWFAWIEQQDSARVPARLPGEGPFPAIEDAPGSYVKVKS